LGNADNLVDIQGAGVQTDEECKPGEGQGAGDINPKCKENEQ